MRDNGLLGKYSRQGYRCGYVDLSTLGYSQQEDYDRDDFLKQKDSWFNVQGTKNWYHVKFSDKAKTDSHVLLSQIYKRAGLKTAKEAMIKLFDLVEKLLKDVK